ncbi:hypothetical protein Q1695_001257 [Nippostrongylus brasiliensis]|nr:hypothetical protein Q1695_001257 [Nippostrongylus brasiliensis]
MRDEVRLRHRVATSRRLRQSASLDNDVAETSVMQCLNPRCSSLGTQTHSLHTFNSRQLCHPKLLLPLLPQVRYLNERIVELFIAEGKGVIELHRILHPCVPRQTQAKVESVVLTDGLPRHRVTARDLVDRTPFSVYGTFDGSIALVKSACTTEESRIDVTHLWKGENPVIAIEVNQLDNALLSAIDFQCVTAQSSLFVLDLVSQSRISLEPRQVFAAVANTNMLDTCWLWDHPSRLLLSTSDCIRLFDIRCPGRTEQALFLDRPVTHMASNRYRTHVFAAFNGEEIHIYDGRQLFGPIQQIKVPSGGYGVLNSMRWNPYMPYELLLHFRDSPKILRCSAQELAFDPFRRRVFDTVTSEDVFSMEQISEGGIAPDVACDRRKMYENVDSYYTLLSYGEMYDKCKRDSDAAMPMCWSTPASEKLMFDGLFSADVNEVFDEQPLKLNKPRRSSVTIEVDLVSTRRSTIRRISSDTRLIWKPAESDLQKRSQALVQNPTPSACCDSPAKLLRTKSCQISTAMSPSPLLNGMLMERANANLIGRLSRSQDNLSEVCGVSCRSVFLAKMRRKSSSCSVLELQVGESGVDNDLTPVPDPGLTQLTAERWQNCIEISNSEIAENAPSVRDGDAKEELRRVCEDHKQELSRIFRRLGGNKVDGTSICMKKRVENALSIKFSTTKEKFSPPSVMRFARSSVRNSITGRKLDDGHRIKLPRKLYSFDVAPVGYSGLLCLMEEGSDRSKLVFTPFIAGDEGFLVKPELLKVLEEIRIWESYDAVSNHLYQAMRYRLFYGMDKIAEQNVLLSMLESLAEHVPRRWMLWLLCSARKQPTYQESIETSDFEESATDGDDPSGAEKNSADGALCYPRPAVCVKGVPGILQLCTLEAESDVTWQSCDSIHFTFLKIARSPVRRLILDPYCLPVTEERIVSDEKFAAGTDILKQIPVIYLHLINGDTVRFIEYTLFLRGKLGEPVYADNPCSFLNAFYFFSTVLSRYVNKISCASNKSSPTYTARRLRLIDRIEEFIKEHRDSPTLNPLFIPMLLLIHGELTCAHPETFTKVVLANEAMPIGLRIAWCVNLLDSKRMKEALHILFQQSTGLDRLPFVGLGRHPDSLQVLSEFLYTTQDCQVFSHLLVAGRCFEEDGPLVEERESDDNSKSDVDDDSMRDRCLSNVPTLYTMFPKSYMHVKSDFPDLLHLARAEFCRYSFILQRMERYCFRRKLMNLVPQICWPEFKTTVDISCIFCGSSYEVALRNAETSLNDQLSQVRARSSVTRTPSNRSSATLNNISSSTLSLPLTSGGTSDSESTLSSSIVNSAAESYYDYNGVDGGTEAEIKRPPDSACPQCRKSYPRCALCGLSYGTPVNDYDHPAGTFSMMFSTCLMCSHGGHSKHVISWFEKENECPVLGCDCRCLYLENGIGRIREQRIMTLF